MAKFNLAKIVAALPATLIENTIYLVRVGLGFDLYATNSDAASTIAHKLNQRRRKTWTQRISLFTDLRWISNVDVNTGTDDGISTEAAGTGVDPLVEWENIGEPLKKGDHLSKLEIRARCNNTEVTEIEIYVMFVRPDPITRWDTGYDNDNELFTEEIYRDFWVNNSEGALGHPINDRRRRVLNLDYTAPEDGEYRIFFKPSGTLTATRFFYPNFILDMILSGEGL